MWKMEGWKSPTQRAHIYDMFVKQEPMPNTSVSTAPARQLLDEIDADIQELAQKCGGMHGIAAQTRGANVAPEPTIDLQKNILALQEKILSLSQDVAMIRDAHASVLETQNMAVGPPMQNDPMAASMEQQPPMNPMGGGMGGMGV